jgi:hypothetical protein
VLFSDISPILASNKERIIVFQVFTKQVKRIFSDPVRQICRFQPRKRGQSMFFSVLQNKAGVFFAVMFGNIVNISLEKGGNN